MRINLATRNSKLALWQANYIKELLLNLNMGLDVKINPIKTEGDRNLSNSLSKFGGKGLFIKELEKSLQSYNSDIAVHSMKDVPVILPRDFIICSVLERYSSRDAFVSNKYKKLSEMNPDSSIATSSIRRQILIKKYHPTLRVLPLRGNIDTRLKKLDKENFDAIILAEAGLQRLGLSNRIIQSLPENIFVPAVGQGAIGVECLKKRLEIINILKKIDHEQTHWQVNLEREISKFLYGSCEMPIGCHVKLINNFVYFNIFLSNLKGDKTIKISEKLPLYSNSVKYIQYFKKKLRKLGALDIIREVKNYES